MGAGGRRNAMRLIDADALMDEVRSLSCGWDEYEAGKDAVIDEIYKAPTIDAVPVARGEWLPYKPDCSSGNSHGNYECSICRSRTYSYILTNLSSFCPNCGSYNGGDKA
jgi:hypothetical protein